MTELYKPFIHRDDLLYARNLMSEVKKKQLFANYYKISSCDVKELLNDFIMDFLHFSLIYLVSPAL